MNPRIRELWDEAAKLESNPSWAGQTKFMERFALLIVRECAELVEYNSKWAGRDIREHFGLEP